MDLDINILYQKMPASDQPGLDTTDSRLSDITSLIEEGNYLKAAAAAQEIFADGVTDIRLLGFFLYGLFLTGEVRGLSEIFNSTVEFIAENWEVAGPMKNREKHGQTVFRWLFNQMSRKFEFEEKSQSTNWQRWLEESGSEDVAQGLASIKVLEEILRERIGQKPDGLDKVKNWLESFQRVVAQMEADAAPAGEETEEDQEILETNGNENLPRRAAARSAASLALAEGGLWAEGSVHLGELMRKLETFELLMGQKKFQQATLVSDDILEAIEHFDPLRYFPKLFSRFFMLLATHSEEILSFDELKESPQWRFLREYFKVDQEGFIDLEISGMGNNGRSGERGDQGYYNDDM